MDDLARTLKALCSGGRSWLVALLLFTFAPLSAAERTLDLTPCARDIGVAGAECGTLEVYENRETAEGRRIGLYVAVLPALGTETKPDPLFLLAGGPGMAATELANAAKTHLRRIREQREIVLVDQRGTGKSNGLDCADVDSTTQSFNVDFPFQALRDCAEALDADLRLYTTPIATDDLDDVRAALGYGSINLWGGSYGTRAALVYLRRHPDRVRTVILDGLAPPDMRLPLHFGEDANRAFDLTFGDCKEDVDCNTAFPNLRDTYHELLDRLEKAPESVRVAHPRTGEMEEIDFGRDDVFLQLRAALYSPDATRLLPLVTRWRLRAAAGLVRALRRGRLAHECGYVVFGALLRRYQLYR